ncbi:MAG: glycoside hydrolase family 27 protein [Clostridiaceae bacterium]|nr:glycoside hydrolase family 27 protein [Clostridiaceae bacterium]
MLAKTPPMGWNSWNTFGNNISDSLIRETADKMVSEGLLAAGYEYLVIDDCWAMRERNGAGLLTPDPVKFPFGMKAVADYVHSKGLKFGMYSCDGTMTCAGYPSSLEHEFVDAQTFAGWGVDFLKYDNCFKPAGIHGKLLYRRMAMALRSTGRDILFSACNWGVDDVETWIRSTGAHMWRSTGDIQDNWASIKRLAMSQDDREPYSGPGCFNDIDMLVVGMYGQGNVALGGCSDTQYQTHFALWCMMNSPLMIGCDIRHMNDATRTILTNKEMIAINQDPEGRQPYTILLDGSHESRAYVKPLSNGEYAIGLFNLSDDPRHLSVQLWDLGLPSAAGYGFKLYDVGAHADAGMIREHLTLDLPAYACRVYRARLTGL